MIIAVDVDEVIAQFLDAWLAFYNSRNNTAWQADQFHSYNFWEVVGGDKESMVELTHEFFKSPEFQNIRPVEDAVEGISALARVHELVIITARPQEISEMTLSWLDTYFPRAFKRVHLTNQFSKLGYWRSKAAVCVEEHASVLIEDNAEYALECARSGVRVLLVDKPWNKDVSHDLIVRVHSWKDILAVMR